MTNLNPGIVRSGGSGSIQEVSVGNVQILEPSRPADWISGPELESAAPSTFETDGGNLLSRRADQPWPPRRRPPRWTEKNGLKHDLKIQALKKH